MAGMDQGEVDIDGQLIWRKAGEGLGWASGVEMSADLRLTSGPGCTTDHVSDLLWELHEADERPILWLSHLWVVSG